MIGLQLSGVSRGILAVHIGLAVEMIGVHSVRAKESYIMGCVIGAGIGVLILGCWGLYKVLFG